MWKTFIVFVSLRKSCSAEFNENGDPVGRVNCVIHKLDVADDTTIPAKQLVRVSQPQGKTTSFADASMSR